MADCKDCIHEKVCSALIKNGLPYIDNEIPAEAFCMTFADKSKYIELPTKVTEKLKEELTKYCYERCVDEL